MNFLSPYYFWLNWRFFNQIRARRQEFFHTNLKKMTWEHYVLERMDVFSTKMGITSVFFKEWTFFTKYWHESNGFLLKIWRKKKGILLIFLVHNIVYFWQNGHFLTKYRHDSRGFFMKNLKKWHETKCFWESASFLDKIWAWEQCVRDWTFFWQNTGIGAVIFSWKIGKKGYPIDFWSII